MKITNSLILIMPTGLERAAESERIRARNEANTLSSRFSRYLTDKNKLTEDPTLLKELDAEFTKLSAIDRITAARILAIIKSCLGGGGSTLIDFCLNLNCFKFLFFSLNSIHQFLIFW